MSAGRYSCVFVASLLLSVLVLSLPFVFFSDVQTRSEIKSQFLLAGLCLSPIAVLVAALIAWKYTGASARTVVMTLGIALPLTIAVSFVSCGMNEGYFPLYPHIDTVFSSGYSAQGWERVAVGMEKGEVLQLLGRPLTDTNVSPSLWSYSCDGKCWWQDFAWEGKQLFFTQEGVVTAKVSRWYGD